jgi:hypothetical protein
MAIFRPLLAPLFWERPGNLPALTRLLQAYCAKAMPEIARQGHVEVRLFSKALGKVVLQEGGCKLRILRDKGARLKGKRDEWPHIEG